MTNFFFNNIKDSKLTGKYLFQGIFLNKVVLDLLTPEQMFSNEFCEISKNTYCVEHLRTTASKITCELLYLIKTFSITINAGFCLFFRIVFICNAF